ncbi:MAG: ArsR family transcriptional regulator [Alphaproteobacteria bacterium]|nr:MAG: ArsR family transcriptional regulator [Alphaproteobacteria bacterium]
MEPTETSRIAERLALLEQVWTDPAGTRPELVEPELTALTAEVVAVIAERGSPTWEQDLEALAHASGRLWHRLPPGADQSEVHWHGHLDAIAQMLGLAIDAQADEAEIKRALATPALAKILQALAEGDAAPTNSELAERCGLSEETVSRRLKDARDCGLVITAKLGRFNRATLTGTGRWAVNTLLRQPDERAVKASETPVVAFRPAYQMQTGPAASLQPGLAARTAELPHAAAA